MPTLMPNDTRAALGQNAEKCDSRSLLLDRFVDPAAKEDGRKEVFTRAIAKKADTRKLAAWQSFLSDELFRNGNGQPPSANDIPILYAQLQSRLMVNMAGGAMENAGLCLDRIGLPYIPGSAVKGCARRAALAALREWCETGGQPEHKPSSADNLFTPACKPFSTPAKMLAAIARVFGWCELDWSDSSDLSWATMGTSTTRQQAAEALAQHFRWTIQPKHKDSLWRDLPNFAGSISFLPAYPVDLGKTGKLDGLPLPLPEPGKLELDVVTCHHRIYYSPEPDRKSNPKKWQEWQEHRTAPDTEEPNPVVFPAVAPGHVFCFPLAPLRGADPSLLHYARTWLATGLQTFGLGAKTNAGYGWFCIVGKKPNGTWYVVGQEGAAESSASSAPAIGHAQPTTQPPSDYDNEAIFRNLVLNRLDRPQDYAQLRQEIPKLQKDVNAPWLEKLKKHLASPAGKEARKRLKQQDWFPKDWLPG